MNITSPTLRQLAYSAIDDRENLRTLNALDRGNMPFRVTYNQNGLIEISVGNDVRKLDCSTDFRCVCRTITIDSEHYYAIKCVSMFVNKESHNQDTVIAITVTEYVKDLFQEDIEKIINNLKAIESETETIGRFDITYNKGNIILEDQVKTLTYRLDHIVQTILDLKK